MKVKSFGQCLRCKKNNASLYSKVFRMYLCHKCNEALIAIRKANHTCDVCNRSNNNFIYIRDNIHFCEKCYRDYLKEKELSSRMFNYELGKRIKVKVRIK